MLMLTAYDNKIVDDENFSLLIPLQPFFVKLTQVMLKLKNDISENYLIISNNYVTQLLKNDVPSPNLDDLRKLLSKMQKRCKRQCAHQYIGIFGNFITEGIG